MLNSISLRYFAGAVNVGGFLGICCNLRQSDICHYLTNSVYLSLFVMDSRLVFEWFFKVSNNAKKSIFLGFWPLSAIKGCFGQKYDFLTKNQYMIPSPKK